MRYLAILLLPILAACSDFWGDDDDGKPITLNNHLVVDVYVWAWNADLDGPDSTITLADSDGDTLTALESMTITDSKVSGGYEKGDSVSIYLFTLEDDGTGELMETLTRTYDELKETRFVVDFGYTVHLTPGDHP
jgi:hypothetical protein